VQKEYKTIKYIHTGVWQTFDEKSVHREIDQHGGEVEKLGKSKKHQAWSCCKNQDFNSAVLCHIIFSLI
jgi:hypothetical protein